MSSPTAYHSKLTIFCYDMKLHDSLFLRLSHYLLWHQMNCEPFVVSLNIYGNTADEPFSTAFLGPNLRTILKTNWTHWIFRPIISVIEKNISIIRKLFSNVQKINYDCLHFSILPSNLTGRRRGNEVWLLSSISGWVLIWFNRSCSWIGTLCSNDHFCGNQ